MFVRTQRLLLRPGWPEDAPALARAIGDEAIVRNLARAPWPYRSFHAEEFLALEPVPRMPSLLIFEAGVPDRPVGGCGLGHDDDGAVELGYWIARTAWGRGYATEAARALIAAARALGHRRLVAGHFVDNPASGRVLAKLGFASTGAIGMHFSRGRGADVTYVGFALDLDQSARGGGTALAA